MLLQSGTGKNSKVIGYRIGGKTGTSEDGVNTGKYVTSFIGVAPISNPQVALLVTLYNPTGEGGHQGGGVAAPIGAQLFGEILPYLDTLKDNETEEEKAIPTNVPNIIGLNLKQASEKLKEAKLEMVINNEQEEIDMENTIVKNQTPLQGVNVNEGSKVYVDY